MLILISVNVAAIPEPLMLPNLSPPHSSVLGTVLAAVLSVDPGTAGITYRPAVKISHRSQ